MATPLQGFRLTARSCSCREVTTRYSTKPIGRRRDLSTTPTLHRVRDRFAKAREVLKEDPKNVFGKPLIAKGNDEALQAALRRYTKEENQDRLGRNYPPPNVPQGRRGKLKETFMNMGDPEPWEVEGTLEDDHDDMPSLAHGELEHHREMRHYARLAAWEMPLLSTMAKPFEAPGKDMPLRFRYTTYMGEQHPAEKKVVLEFCPQDMPDLTDIQKDKLRKLVGTRYNPEKDIVKMSCEMFETPAQNKRYLGDLVEDLLEESRTGDTFEDVPLDTRHHHFKYKPKFPKEWTLTEQRKQELAKYRKQMEELDHKRGLTGQLVDGIKQIEQVLANPSPEMQRAVPEMVMAGNAKARGKKVSVRR